MKGHCQSGREHWPVMQTQVLLQKLKNLGTLPGDAALSVPKEYYNNNNNNHNRSYTFTVREIHNN